MPHYFKKYKIFSRLKKSLIIVGAIVLTLVLLVSTAVIFLPAAVSTEYAHRLMESQASRVLARDVSIKALHWTWKDGLALEEFMVPDLPDYSENPAIYINEIKVKPDIKKLIRRTLAVTFAVSGLDIRAIKNPDGNLNLSALGKKSPSEPLAVKQTTPIEKKPDAPKEKKAEAPFVLPVDISAQIRLSHINFSYDDRVKKEQYAISDLEFRLDAPSVKTAPVALILGTDIRINDQAIPRATLGMNIQNLFGADGSLSINSLLAALDADLPGMTAHVRADMAASGITGDIQMDLAQITAIAGPLVPAFPSPTDIGGMLSLTVKTSTDPEAPMAFDALLKGSALKVSGAIIDGKSLGPGDLSLALAGVLDLNQAHVKLISGDITLLHNSHLRVSGQVDHFKSDVKDINFAVSPLYLDVDEIVSFIKPFLPPTLVLAEPGNKTDISLQKLTFSGQMPKGRTDVRIDGLALSLPKFILKDQKTKNDTLTLAGTHLHLEALTARLVDFFPESANAALSIGIDEFLSGEQKTGISISGIRLNHFTLAADGLLKAETFPFAVQGGFTLENHLRIDRVFLPDLIRISSLNQSLKVQADLAPEGAIGAVLDHFNVDAPELMVLNNKIAPLQSGMKLNLALEKMDLKTLDPLSMDVKNFLARLDLDDALSLLIQAGAKDSGNKAFTADLQLSSDLAALFKRIPSSMTAGISGAGNLSIDAHAAGRRPTFEETQKLKTLNFSDNLNFMEKAGIKISLDAGRFVIPQTEGPAIIIGHVEAAPLLSYDLNGPTGVGRINSRLTAGDFGGLPGLPPDTPLSAVFTMTGGHEYARAIDLHPSISLVPSDANASVDIMINGLDRVFQRSPRPGPILWMADMGGEINARAVVPDCSRLKDLGLPGLSGIDCTGGITAGLGIRLKPNDSLHSGLFLTVRDMDFSSPGALSANAIQANLDLSKTYRIAWVGRSLPGTGESGLSSDVMNSPAATWLFPQNKNISSHIRQVHERINPAPAFSVEAADIPGAPFPLFLGASMVMLNLKNGLPQLDYFQLNLLGGTVNGSIALAHDPRGNQNQKNGRPPFSVSTALNFSGINFAEIFPEAFAGENIREADISGLLYADFPLTDQLQNLLENTELRIEFTHIGARALERILYALDPHETNEAMTAQRGLLKAGSPKQIRLIVKDGFLSLTGEVAIRGITIPLPAIQRLNLARIPGLARFQGSLSGLSPVISILQIVSADNIIINRQADTVSFE